MTVLDWTVHRKASGTVKTARTNLESNENKVIAFIEAGLSHSKHAESSFFDWSIKRRRQSQP